MNDINKMQKYVISRQKELEELLEKDIQDLLERIAQDTVKKIKVFIRQYWYNKYTPQNYKRTNSLYNSVTYVIEGKHIYIYFDLSAADRHPGNSEEWGSYTNFQGDPSFKEEIFWENMVEYIDTGKFPGGTGSVNNPRLGHGIDFIAKTERWLDKYLKDKVDKEIKIFVEHNKVF